MSNMPASITLEGRLAFDPELNVDQESGRKSVRITVIQNKGYSKETEHIVSFSCYFGGYEAERLIKAKAKKGSVVTIVGNFDSREYMRQNPANQSDPNDQIHDRSLEVYVWSWWFTPQNKPKEEPNPANGSAPANPGGYANNGQYAAPAQANTIPLKDFVDKYILTQGRTFTPEEEATIPILPSWYIIPPEIKQICEHAQKTTGSHAMRNFLLRGPAGTGKSEGAKAIAAAMHLPYRFLTCSAGTEIFDLIGQIMPAMNPKPKENNHWERPTFMDIQMDPASVHYAFTKEYDESVDENTVFDEVLQFMEERIRAEQQNGSGSAQSFEYVDTPLVEAIRNGYVIEIQEPSVIANPAVLVGLNGLLDQCKSLTLPTGEIVERHPDTVVIITTNTDYAGCKGMNQSVISRMNLVIDLEEPDEATLVDRVKGITGCKNTKAIQKMAKIVKNINEYCRESSIRDGCCGVRELIAWVQSYMICNDMSEAAKYTVLASASADSQCREEIETSCIKTRLAT